MRGAALGIATMAALIGSAALISVDATPRPRPGPGPGAGPANGTDELLLQEPNTETESRRNNVPQYANNFGYQHQSSYSPYSQQYPYPIRPNGYRPLYPGSHLYGSRPNLGYPQQQQQQGLMQVLESIASYDELHCVPKILCEMTSSASKRGYGQQSSSQSFINLESILTLLSSVDDYTASPLVKFGKAFILGYTSHHTGSCQYAYPRCPSDPDRLVHYLNNHNGGLFHLFNLNQNFQVPQRRIQTKPNEISPALNIYDYDENRDKRQYGWRFPAFDTEIHNYENDDGRGDYRKKGKSLKFPNEQETKTKTGYRITQNSLPFYFPDRTKEDLRLNNDIKEYNDMFVFKDFK